MFVGGGGKGGGGATNLTPNQTNINFVKFSDFAELQLVFNKYLLNLATLLILRRFQPQIIANWPQF